MLNSAWCFLVPCSTVCGHFFCNFDDLVNAKASLATQTDRALASRSKGRYIVHTTRTYGMGRKFYGRDFFAPVHARTDDPYLRPYVRVVWTIHRGRIPYTLLAVHCLLIYC